MLPENHSGAAHPFSDTYAGATPAAPAPVPRGLYVQRLGANLRGERNLTLDSVDALASRLDLDTLGLLTGGPQRP